MDLQKSFELQLELQRIMPPVGRVPGDIVDPEEKIEFIKDMVLALEDELHEALGETGWKPWATSRHINVDAFKSELVDAFHFFMNLCLAVNMTADELQFLHAEKVKVNRRRQEEGYDGVSTKCRWCGRALDDKAVSCENDLVQGTGFCALKAKDTADGFFTSTDLEGRYQHG